MPGADLWASRASGSCHDVVVTTTERRSPRETPKNKEFDLTSTFQMVIILWMDCPVPCPALTGVVLFYGPPHPLILRGPDAVCKTPVVMNLADGYDAKLPFLSPLASAPGCSPSWTTRTLSRAFCCQNPDCRRHGQRGLENVGFQLVRQASPGSLTLFYDSLAHPLFRGVTSLLSP